jgi:hypothetical protein
MLCYMGQLVNAFNGLRFRRLHFFIQLVVSFLLYVNKAQECTLKKINDF